MTRKIRVAKEIMYNEGLINSGYFRDAEKNPSPKNFPVHLSLLLHRTFTHPIVRMEFGEETHDYSIEEESDGIFWFGYISEYYSEQYGKEWWEEQKRLGNIEADGCYHVLKEGSDGYYHLVHHNSKVSET